MKKYPFKKPLCALLALLIMAAAGCVKIKTDPAEPSPSAEGSVTTKAPVPTGSACPDVTAAPEAEAPGSDFYSMTMAESYEKYGFFTFLSFAVDNWYDGEKYYSLHYVSEEGEHSVYAPMTLKYRDYPDGETWSPVCSDPLCAHTGAAGCPLAKCQNLFGYACMAGRVFFVGSDGVLYLFNGADNSCTALHDKVFEYKLYEQDGALYVVYQVEDEEFNVRFAALKTTPEGEVTELGSVSELYAGKECPVYADRYLVDARIDGETACVYLRDMRTDSVKTVCDIEYSGEPVTEAASASAVAVYGDKALLRIMYRTDRERDDIYLIDLVSGEARFLASKIGTVQNWLYSDRCVIWAEPRSESADPFIVHLLFPITDEEQTFDLSALAAKDGGSISLGVGLAELKKGALLLNCTYGMASGTDEDGKTIYQMVNYNAFEFDLESGRVFAYKAPDLPEYASLFK